MDEDRSMFQNPGKGFRPYQDDQPEGRRLRPGDAVQGVIPSETLKQKLDRLGIKVCGFRAFGMMPPCILVSGHSGPHADGFGGHYGEHSFGIEVAR